MLLLSFILSTAKNLNFQSQNTFVTIFLDNDDKVARLHARILELENESTLKDKKLIKKEAEYKKKKDECDQYETERDEQKRVIQSKQSDQNIKKLLLCCWKAKITY